MYREPRASPAGTACLGRAQRRLRVALLSTASSQPSAQWQERGEVLFPVSLEEPVQDV